MFREFRNALTSKWIREAAENQAATTRHVRRTELIEKPYRTPREEHELHLLESRATLLNDAWGVRQNLWQPDLTDFNRGGYGPLFGNAEHRNGIDWPFFINEVDLSLLRSRSRMLVRSNPNAFGLLGNIRSYTFGKGMTWSVKPRDETPDPELVKLADLCKRIIDTFARANRLKKKSREFFDRSHVDGEGIYRLFDDEDGVRLRFVWPEQIRTPPDELHDGEWGFGRHVDPDDAEVTTEWAVFPSTEPNDMEPEIVPADEIVFYGPNALTGVRRSIPTFSLGLADALKSADRLSDSVGFSAAEQADIIYIRQHANVPTQAIRDFASSNADATQGRPGTGKTDNVKYAGPGPKVLDTGKNTDYLAGPINMGMSAFLEVEKALVRRATTYFRAPEWMGNSDASSNSFANALAADAPFTKATEERQDDLEEVFCDLFERVLTLYSRRGKLPADVLELVEVVVEYPNPEVRNKFEESQRHAMDIATGIESPQGACAESGRDWEKIKREREEIGLPNGPPQQQPGQEGQEQETDDDEEGEGLDDLPGTSADELDEYFNKAIQESVLESFTGEVTDKLGRKRHYVDGKPVKGGGASKEKKPKKPKKLTINSLEKTANEHLKKARAARAAGNEDDARNFVAAAHGHFRAAKHIEDGEPEVAEAIRKVADEFATGKRRLPGTEGPKPAAMESLLESDDHDGPSEEDLSTIADILHGLFGDDALDFFDQGEDVDGVKESLLEGWDEASHPRGKGGRFIPKGSAEAVAATHEKIDSILKGEKTPATHKELTEHLALLTTQQLHAIKGKYELKASGASKAALVEKLADRLGRGRVTGEKKEEGAKPAEKAAEPAKASSHEEHIAKALTDAEPGAVLGLDEIRNQLPEHMRHGPEFDKAVLAMAGRKDVQIFKDADPAQFSPEELKDLVHDENGNVYTTIRTRNLGKKPADAPQADATPTPAASEPTTDVNSFEGNLASHLSDAWHDNPDPATREALERVMENAGITKPLPHSGGKAKSGMKPQTDGDIDHQRDLAADLASTWKDNPDPKTRAALEKVMEHAGLKKVGDVGGQVPFNGNAHHTDDPDLLPGESATVHEPGWSYTSPRGTMTVAHAKVGGPPPSSEPTTDPEIKSWWDGLSPADKKEAAAKVPSPDAATSPTRAKAHAAFVANPDQASHDTHRSLISQAHDIAHGPVDGGRNDGEASAFTPDPAHHAAQQEVGAARAKLHDANVEGDTAKAAEHADEVKQATAKVKKSRKAKEASTAPPTPATTTGDEAKPHLNDIAKHNTRYNRPGAFDGTDTLKARRSAHRIVEQHFAEHPPEEIYRRAQEAGVPGISPKDSKWEVLNAVENHLTAGAKAHEQGEKTAAQAAAKPKPTDEKVTPQQFNTHLQEVKDRIDRNEPLRLTELKAELAKYEALPHAKLHAVLKSMGYAEMPRNKEKAIDMIANRLLAARIAGNRAEI